jgi:hypothetical protein
MVHALQIAERILLPGGFVINVHDHPIPHMIEIKSSDTLTRVGWLLSKEEFKAERSAFNALAQVVDDGFFILDDEQDFEVNLYIDGLAECQAWLAETWESAFLTDTTINRIEELVRVSNIPSKIKINTPARMTKLRVV